jgi:tight adherence protein B
LAAVSLLAGGTLLAGAAGAANQGVTIVEAGARFPDRAYIVRLPQQADLRPAQVHVFENGREVAGVTVSSASTARGAEKFSLVLVIDESNSMRGSPIRNALLAAQAFATRIRGQRVAVVTFNARPVRLLAPTAERAPLDAVLRRPPQLAEGTYIYDALRVALGVLKQANAPSGSIVLLSDGADTGSAHSISAVLSEARAARVRIFSIGLRSSTYKAEPLRQIARGSGGSYAEASTPDALLPIYEALGERLGNEYLLQYKSPAGPNSKVNVTVRVDGFAGRAVTGYTTAALPKVALPPYHKSFADRFFESWFAMALFVLVSAMLIGVASHLAFRRRPRTLLRRMSHFVRSSTPETSHPTRADLAERIFAVTERSLERTQRWTRFKQMVELAEITLAPVQIVAWTFAATLFAVFLLVLITGSFLLGILGLFVPLISRALLLRKLNEKRARFAQQLPDNLEVLSSALRAGHSLVGALSVVVQDAPEPSRSEFQRVIADEQLGVPLEDAIGTVVERMANRDLDQVAVVAALQRETGGNSAEVLDRVTETVRQRQELRRLIATLTAQGRISRWVVSLLPVFLLFAILLLNPSYINPLLTHGWGRFLLFVATIMVVSGSLVIKRIINIKV